MAKKVVKKAPKSKEEDHTLTLTLGIILVCINNFTEGGILEKILVCCGFGLMLLGLVPMIKENIKKNRKASAIAEIVLCILVVVLAVMLIINSINK